MSRRHRLALRTEAVIEHMHARGISAESIAGETRVRLDRVVAHIATLTSKGGADAWDKTHGVGGRSWAEPGQAEPASVYEGLEE
jgi:hypothetical protein